MKYLNFIGILLCLINIKVSAQCPTASFSLPDSICAGSSITLNNGSTGTGSLTYDWDFHLGDMSVAPAAHLLGTYPSVTNSFGSHVVFDGSNYFMFVQSNGSLTRFDFGNSLNNTPTETVLGNIDGLMGGSADIRILQEGSNWYGIVNCWNNRILKLSFGNSLTNFPTGFELILNNNGLSFPYYMTAVYDGTNYFILTCNLTNSTITVANLGSTLANDTANCTNFAIIPNSFPTGISVAVDCDQWYGFATYSGGGGVSQVSFGNSLANPNPTVSNLILSGIGASREIETFNVGAKWYGIVGSLDGSTTSLLSFGNSIGNINVDVTALGSLGQLATGEYTFTVNSDNSVVNVFSVNSSTGNITQIQFPDLSQNIPATSTSINPIVNFNGSGWSSVSLKVTDSNGMVTFVEDSVYLNPLPAASFSTSVPCEGSDILFTNTTTIPVGLISSSNWAFGDNNFSTDISPVHQYASAGNYEVILNSGSDHGCFASDTVTITVNQNPTADFSFIDNQCAKAGISFNDLSISNTGTLTNWNWNFGDNDSSIIQFPVHAYNTDTIFTIQFVVTSSTGCTDTIQKQITILPKPHAAYSVFNTCTGETSQFMNQSTIHGTSTLNYDWTFGDLSTGTNLPDPTHAYPASTATYQVELIVHSTDGCDDTLFQNLHIGERPLPHFTIASDTACVGNNFIFIDSSFAASGETIAVRYWDFGDNTYDSSSVNPVHQYASSGSYTVHLTVVSPSDCDSTYSHTIYVIDSPTANFTTSDVCLGIVTPFNDASTSPSGTTISSWSWNFDDTGTSNAKDTSHLYATPSTYNVSLNVISSTGCLGSISKQVIVYSLPEVNFGISKACTGTPVTFSDSSTVNNALITAWNWNFGDSSTADPNQNPQHTYLNTAAFPITLVVTSSQGCQDSLTKFKIIDQSPLFNIAITDVCFHLSNNFQYQPVGTPISNPGFEWAFGDATFASLANPTHTYSNSGNYLVSLTTTDLSNGCFSVKSDTAYVHSIPVANYQKDSSCVNQALQLNDLSTTADGIITSWNWNFGSHGTSSLQNPTLTLAVADSFSVKLKVTSNFGCTDSIVKNIRVFPLPLVNFTPSLTYGSPPLPVSFTNTSNASTYSWNFGDGSSINFNTNPSHTFADTGLYKIVLTGTSYYGCVDSIHKYVSVLIPYLDLSVEGISYNQVGSLWQLKARIRNLGNIDVRSFEINAKLDGKSIINEYWSADTIFAGNLFDFTFATRFEAADNNEPGFMCVTLLKANDQTDDNSENNQRCVTSGKEFEVFELYPNPFVDYFNIGINLPEQGSVGLNLYDLSEKKAYTKNITSLSKGYNTITIDDLHLQAGMYILSIHYQDKTIIRKVIAGKIN